MSLEAICDFDGTITDNSHAYDEYSEEFSLLLIRKFSLPVSDFEKAVFDSKEEIITDPKLHGWVDNGFIVAPATSEPLVFFTAIAQLALSKLGKTTTADELSKIHSKSLEKVELRFRKGAYDFVTTMNRHTNFTIVTNSKEADTSKKVFLLLGENDIKVVGNAKKNKINPLWEKVPLSIQIPNFPREIFLRRQLYYEAMSKVILDKAPYVVGDIYEFDLALPDFLKFPTFLVLSPSTPDWEIEYYKTHPNGFSSNSLLEIEHNIFCRR